MNQFGGFVNLYLEIYVSNMKISSKNSQKPKRNRTVSQNRWRTSVWRTDQSQGRSLTFLTLLITSNPMTLLISVEFAQLKSNSRKLVLDEKFSSWNKVDLSLVSMTFWTCNLKVSFFNFSDALYQDLFWNRTRNVCTKFSKNLENWTTAFEQLNDTLEETILTQV